MQSNDDNDDDDDDDDDDDLDDEAMFKLDNALAAAFKLRTGSSKKAKQEREKQLTAFKHR